MKETKNRITIDIMYLIRITISHSLKFNQSRKYHFTQWFLVASVSWFGVHRKERLRRLSRSRLQSRLDGHGSKFKSAAGSLPGLPVVLPGNHGFQGVSQCVATVTHEKVYSFSTGQPIRVFAADPSLRKGVQHTTLHLLVYKVIIHPQTSNSIECSDLVPDGCSWVY